MDIRIHPHALERMAERGASETEVALTVKEGEEFPAKFERSGFRRNFVFNTERKGKWFSVKQLEVYAVRENAGWPGQSLLTGN